MPCEDDEHLFYIGTHAEVVRLAEGPFLSPQTARTWPCAMCHERIDLLAVELARRAQGEPGVTR